MLTKEIRYRIESELKLGKSIALVSREMNTRYDIVRSIAGWIGWNISWRRKEYFKIRTDIAVNPNTSEILRRYDNGERQINLAKDYKLSRERIRQIIKASGRESARSKARKISEQKIKQYQEMLEAKRVLDQENFIKRWILARQMWDEGKTIPEITKEYNITEGTMWSYVCNLRKQLGWFPRRKMPGPGVWQPKNQDNEGLPF
jgi:Mor family transcriptional regulator